LNLILKVGVEIEKIYIDLVLDSIGVVAKHYAKDFRCPQQPQNYILELTSWDKAFPFASA